MDDSFFDLHTYEGQWIEGLIYASKGSKLAKNWIEGLLTPIPIGYWITTRTDHTKLYSDITL
ncbi:MAG TPA: hypothetical protein ENI29_22935 [bacterium]|nr:hypothetical protein [bacterium]